MTPLLRKASDDRAFERLYQRHVKDVFRYSLAVLGEPADAEDVTQTTFLNAYRAFQRGERPEKPQNWLIAIAHNVCRQRFRQQQRRPREVELDEEFGGAVEPDDEGPSVEELRRAFAALPPNQRAALVMRELEGRSYAEIAEVIGISVSALETLLFRARRSLREQLEEQLTCRDAAFAISKQLDGRLAAGERRALRAHLRSCPECAALAHSQRAQRRALRTLLAVPLPVSLQTFAWHGGEVASTAAAAGGAGIAVKAAAVVAGASLVGGGAFVGVETVPPLVEHHAPARVRHTTPAPAAATPKARSRPAVVAAVVAKPAPEHTKVVAAHAKPNRQHPGSARPEPKHVVPATPVAVPPVTHMPPALGRSKPRATPKAKPQQALHAQAPKHVRATPHPVKARVVKPEHRRPAKARALPRRLRTAPADTTTTPVVPPDTPQPTAQGRDKARGKGNPADLLPAETP